MKSGSTRVLLVNDDADALFLLEHAVGKECPGAIRLTCRSAVEALKILGTTAVDAIITDNAMPEMDGLTFVRRVRARDPSTPILMLTGSDQVRSAALELGVTAFVCSANWNEIRSGIRRVLGPGSAP